MRSLKAAVILATILCVGSTLARAQQGPPTGPGQGESSQGPSGGQSPAGGQDPSDSQGLSGTPGGPDASGGAQGAPGGGMGPGGEPAPGEMAPGGSPGQEGPGGTPGAGGPGSGPDAGGGGGQEPQMVGDRGESTGETGIWLVLLVLVVVAVMGWKRVGEWGKLRLEPAVEQLHRAATSLDARSRAVRISAWSPSLGAMTWGSVLGENWILPGHIAAVSTSEDGLAETAVIDLLKLPGCAVGLVSDQVDSARLSQGLGAEHQGRLLLSDDSGCLQDGIGSLIGALEGAGAPVAAVLDLRGTLGGVDVLGSLSSVARGLYPWVQAHDLALLLVLPRGLSVEAMAELSQTPEIHSMARFEEGRLERIESVA